MFGTLGFLEVQDHKNQWWTWCCSAKSLVKQWWFGRNHSKYLWLEAYGVDMLKYCPLTDAGWTFMRHAPLQLLFRFVVKVNGIGARCIKALLSTVGGFAASAEEVGHR